jgi:hypothetical protein
MHLYNLKPKESISILKEKPFKLEREIQTLFESNLNELMNLQLVKSEFSIKQAYRYFSIRYTVKCIYYN